MKPYSESCDQNRDPILNVIEPLFRDCQTVLEIGSGTGQHAVYFAEKMPHLTWQTSDLEENHDGICQWLDDAGLPNVRRPLLLDMLQENWPTIQTDAVYSANAIHIMGMPAVEKLFAGVGRLLTSGGLLVTYGPYNYKGQYTSESNAQFDRWLKSRNPESGIRDFESVDKLANAAGMTLLSDYEMPANNRILCWRK